MDPGWWKGGGGGTHPAWIGGTGKRCKYPLSRFGAERRRAKCQRPQYQYNLMQADLNHIK